MKLTSIATVEQGKLEFNDLGSVIKGVAPQAKFINLNSGDAVYIPDSGEVMYSAQAGDAYRYQKAGLLVVNETLQLAAAASYVIKHNFGFLPKIAVAKQDGNTWKDCSFETIATVSIITNAAMTETTITNVTAGALVFHVRIS